MTLRQATGIILLIGGIIAIMSLDPIKLLFRIGWNFSATLFGGEFV